MPIETWLGLLLFAFTTSITPGPNNMMLLASGVNYGFRRTLPHLLGVEVGFGSLILFVGLGVGAILLAEPRLYLVLKVLGGGYLLWIAWKIGTTRKMATAEGNARPFRFDQAALFQFVNPKAWVMAVGANAAFADPAHFVRDTLLVVLAFMSVGVFSTGTWVFFGTVMKRFLEDETRLKWFNIVMALLLVASLWPMLR